MKKTVAIIGAVVVVLILGGAVGAVLISTNKSTAPSSSKAPVQEPFTAKAVDACKVLTQEIATTYLGETPTESSVPQTMEYSEDIAVSNCAFTTKFVVGQPDSLRSVSLFARTAKTQAGATANQRTFTDQLPEGAQKVTGYGTEAFWDPTLGQLSILKNNNWYIVTGGQSTYPEKRTFDDAKKLADLIISQL